MLEVVKNNTTDSVVSENSNKINTELVAKLRAEFDVLNAQLLEKKYKIVWDEKSAEFFSLLKNGIEFRGSDGYGMGYYAGIIFPIIEETIGTKTELEAEYLDALINIIKTYSGKGYENLMLFKFFMMNILTAYKELKEDRENLSKLSTELQAAELGISVEKYIENVQKVQ